MLKKGDTIIITDFGKAKPGYRFSKFKPYVLKKDFTRINGLKVEKDDRGDANGWDNAFQLGIKIEPYIESPQ